MHSKNHLKLQNLPELCELYQSQIAMYLVVSRGLSHFFNILFTVGLTQSSLESRKSPFPPSI